MSIAATQITADAYLAEAVEGERTQLVEGTVVVNEPKLIHGRLQLRLLIALASWTAAGPRRGEAFPPTDVRVDEHNVYAPDLLWFSAAHMPSDLDSYPERIPDLCVEIRSAGTWRHDVGAKKRVYESGGLPELWLVDDAAETVLVYRRSEPSAPVFDVELELARGESLGSPQLPGFELALERLFER